MRPVTAGCSSWAGLEDEVAELECVVGPKAVWWKRGAGDISEKLIWWSMSG